MQLITDKISLPNERPHVSRTRLLELLRRSTATYSTTIISGRTGTGKTLLAVDFAYQCRRRVAWYSVDATDKYPRFFFRYLLESLRQIRPDLRFPSLATLGGTCAETGLEQLAESIIYELQEGEAAEPILLVIDDLHLIYDEPWVLPFFRRFIPLLPSDIHLLLLARSVIPMPLWRLRSKQNLLTLDEGGLAFTQEEATTLFAARGLGTKQALDALQLSRGRASVMDELARQMSHRTASDDMEAPSLQRWPSLVAA